VIEVVISRKARADIAAILAWSNDVFGHHAMHRYKSLIGAALEDLAENPLRPGSDSRPELGLDCRTFHLIHSRKRSAKKGATVKSPRHFAVCRIRERHIEIARFLHDSMDVDDL